MGKEGCSSSRPTPTFSIRSVRSTVSRMRSWTNGIDLMEAEQRWVKAQGAAMVIVVAPNQHTIYPERMPLTSIGSGRTRLDQIMRRLQERGSISSSSIHGAICGPRGNRFALSQIRGSWNVLGAFIATGRDEGSQEALPALQLIALSDYAISQGYRAWNIPPRRGGSRSLAEVGEPYRRSQGPRQHSPLRPIVETTTILAPRRQRSSTATPRPGHGAVHQ